MVVRNHMNSPVSDSTLSRLHSLACKAPALKTPDIHPGIGHSIPEQPGPSCFYL